MGAGGAKFHPSLPAPPAPSEHPYSAVEAAEKLGLSVAAFHRNFPRLVALGMPAPLLPWGRKKFRRREFDAWLALPNKRPLPAAANDDRAPADWRQILSAEYGS